MVDNLMNILKITEWFKWVNCIVCKLYLNNTVSEKEESRMVVEMGGGCRRKGVNV